MDTDIARKIQALLAKAEGTTNVHEAEAFAAKAHELLARHNLELCDLDANCPQNDRQAWTSPVLVTRRWEQLLWSYVAQAFFCLPLIVRSGSRARVQLIGAEHNIAAAKSAAECLISTVRRLARNFSNLSSTRTDFCNGAVIAVAVRLQSLASDREAKSAAGTSLPALYSTEKERNEQYVRERFAGGVRPARSRKAAPMTTASLAGYRAGQQISLHDQIKADAC